MCARENDGARVGFEKQVPACRVPRGRLDSEAATRWQDPRGTTSARLCESVSLSHEYSHPKSTCYPLAPAHALARGVRERMNGCRAQARWLLLSTDRESIRRQPPYFRPRNLNFYARQRVDSSYFRPYSLPDCCDTLDLTPVRKWQPGVTWGSFFATR